MGVCGYLGNIWVNIGPDQNVSHPAQLTNILVKNHRQMVFSVLNGVFLLKPVPPAVIEALIWCKNVQACYE